MLDLIQQSSSNGYVQISNLYYKTLTTNKSHVNNFLLLLPLLIYIIYQNQHHLSNKQAFTKSGSDITDIYQSFVSTAVVSCRSKNMCCAPNGRFVTGAPNVKASNSSNSINSAIQNSAIQNKKVERITGHIFSIMLSRMRQRGHKDNTYDGRDIAYNYPNGGRNYGICSFKGRKFPWYV